MDQNHELKVNKELLKHSQKKIKETSKYHKKVQNKTTIKWIVSIFKFLFSLF